MSSRVREFKSSRELMNLITNELITKGVYMPILEMPKKDNAEPKMCRWLYIMGMGPAGQTMIQFVPCPGSSKSSNLSLQKTMGCPYYDDTRKTCKIDVVINWAYDQANKKIVTT